MGIQFNNNVFKLDTKNTTYLFKISKDNYLEHIYYGTKVEDIKYDSISNRQIYSFGLQDDYSDRTFSLGTVLQEVATFSDGDLRTPSLVINNNVSKRFKYNKHEIINKKVALKNLPSSRDNGNVTTLIVSLLNEDKTVELKLYYSVYENEDVICRHMEVTNLQKEALNLLKTASICLDLSDSDYSMVTLQGFYLSERSTPTYRKLGFGIQSNASFIGASSHYTNPFMAIVKTLEENDDEAYGFNLVYSGNFKNDVEVDRLGQTRITCGINETGFSYYLNNNESFITPEVVMTYSLDGLGGVSRNMHEHILNNIVEPAFSRKSHPIVINSWEAYYFDVTEEKILKLAEAAKKCDIDTIVIDDGWFRDDINHGLGDWKAIPTKFLSLANLSKKIHQMGLKFGIWVEPEMVAMQSELYLKNPKCILSVDNKPFISRNQFVLDLTNDENINYVFNRIVEEFKDVEIDYIKWDYNRYIGEGASFNTLPGEVYHKQVLGTYKLFTKFKETFPNVFFENCSGGGGRFDLGMLYYAPQIWASDNTDPYERTYIQYGTSIAYPMSSISCHLSEGHCTSGRVSTTDFRYLVASFGSFGFELDLNKYTDEDFKVFKEYIRRYKQKEQVVLNGDLYRLISPKDNQFCAYLQVSKDKSIGYFTFIELFARGMNESIIVKIDGLDENKLYKNNYNNDVVSGKALKYIGFRVNNLFRDIRSNGLEVIFEEVK